VHGRLSTLTMPMSLPITAGSEEAEPLRIRKRRTGRGLLLSTSDLDTSAWYHSRVTGPNTRCPKRAALAEELAGAAALVDAAKLEHDHLNKSRFPTREELLRLVELVEALTKARKRAREAQRAFDAHVDVHHHCSA
jgi:hypothetical protein